jgi:hypothetical protein
MTQRIGRMISMEVGVADEAAGRAIASLMMGEASPSPGTERIVADGSVLTYLRAFNVLERVRGTEPAVWVDFGIRYDSNADADPISGWLFNTLMGHGHPVALRVDTSSIPCEIEAMTALIRSKVKRSVVERENDGIP